MQRFQDIESYLNHISYKDLYVSDTTDIGNSINRPNKNEKDVPAISVLEYLEYVKL